MNHFTSSLKTNLTGLELVRIIYGRIVNGKTFVEIKQLGYDIDDANLLGLLFDIGNESKKYYLFNPNYLWNLYKKWMGDQKENVQMMRKSLCRKMVLGGTK